MWYHHMSHKGRSVCFSIINWLFVIMQDIVGKREHLCCEQCAVPCYSGENAAKRVTFWALGAYIWDNLHVVTCQYVLCNEICYVHRHGGTVLHHLFYLGGWKWPHAEVEVVIIKVDWVAAQVYHYWHLEWFVSEVSHTVPWHVIGASSVFKTLALTRIFHTWPPVSRPCGWFGSVWQRQKGRISETSAVTLSFSGSKVILQELCSEVLPFLNFPFSLGVLLS